MMAEQVERIRDLDLSRATKVWVLHDGSSLVMPDRAEHWDFAPDAPLSIRLATASAGLSLELQDEGSDTIKNALELLRRHPNPHYVLISSPTMPDGLAAKTPQEAATALRLLRR